MKISASLFSKKSEWESYASQLEYAGVDYIHVDYLEGTRAPIPIESLTPQISKLPYDVHVIAQRLSDSTIEALNQSTTAYFCVQYENLTDKSDLQKIKEFNGNRGIGFTIETPINIVESYITQLDFILVMCSIPGISGAKFDGRNIERIQYLREKYPALSIHVDGGINQEKMDLMEKLGVSLCVSGSYLASTEGMDLIQRVCGLKFMNTEVKVADLMKLRKNIIPVLEDDSFGTLLDNINRLHMGTAFVENANHEYVGIITDGDVRRSILKNKQNVFQLSVKDIVNKEAYCVDKGKRLVDVFLERMLLQRQVSVIPVVEGKRLVGVLDLKKYF